MKCGVCSDIDLEYRFKHMTSKQHELYLKDQIKNLKKLTDVCIKQKIDALFIVGNLFAIPRLRKNTTFETVAEELQKISNKGIEVFILPGARDTLLDLSNDQSVHFVYDFIENVHVLQEKLRFKKKSQKIQEPLFEGTIAEEPIRLYSLRSPFIKPDLYKFEIEVSDEFTNILLVPDLLSFKNEASKIAKSFFKGLTNKGFDYIILGGIAPFDIDKQNKSSEKNGYQIINAPQVHIYNFHYIDQPNGMKILSLPPEPKKKIKIHKISNFGFDYHELNVQAVKPNEINTKIEEIIKLHPTAEASFLRIVLTGKISREDYHQIEIFKHIEKGNRLNYYFELKDLVEFDTMSPDITNFSVMEELKIFVDKKVEQGEYQRGLSNKALKLIGNDWRR